MIRPERLTRVLARLAGMPWDAASGLAARELVEQLARVDMREWAGRVPAERALAPFLTLGEDWLEQRCARCTPLLGPGARRGLLGMLSHRLGRVCLQVLLLEQQVLELSARMFGRPAELEPGAASWLDRFEQYPVLASVMAKAFAGWRAHVNELIERLTADGPWLADTLFAGHALPLVADIEGEAGDVHERGRSVAVLRFEDGRQLVYKPRDLHATQAVQALFTWLNAAESWPPLHVRAVLPREGYGWEEHISAAPCRHDEEVARFHVRVGMLLRLMQLVEASDLTLDNVLACGEYPVIIDLEVILQPRKPAVQEDASEQLLHESVARLGMLSTPFLYSPGVRAENVGVLTPPRELSYARLLPASATAAGDWPYRDGHPDARAERHALFLGAQPVDASAHMDAVLEGYRRMHAALRRHSEALLAPHGPLAAFAGRPVRYIHRATERYVRALWSGMAPEALVAPGPWRARVEARLPREGTVEEPAILEYEMAALAASEIPLFLCRSDGEALLGADGRSVVEGFFVGSALERVRQRLLAVDAFPLGLHEDMLLSTFSTSRPTRPRVSPCAPRDVSPCPGEWLEAAAEIGELLVDSALPGKGGLTWVGIAYEPFHDYEWLDRLESELLSGSTGIALVLAELYAATARDTFRKTALQALEEVRRTVAQAPRELKHASAQRSKLTPVGAFVGIGANLHVLASCAALLEAPALADEARACAEVLPVEELCATQGVDLITGVSGLLLALHRAGATAQARAGLGVLLKRREEEARLSYPPGARILGALPDARLARALCISRIAGEASPLPAPELTAGSLLARLELARESRERELIRSEIGRYLELSEEGDLSRLERLDVALEAELDDPAVRLGLTFLQARQESGRWFPEQWAADRHQLSALWGLPALAHAFLRLGIPGRFSSLRLVR